MPFIVDFTRLHGRRAARMGLPLSSDAGWWAFVAEEYHTALAATGADPVDDAPLSPEGAPPDGRGGVHPDY